MAVQSKAAAVGFWVVIAALLLLLSGPAGAHLGLWHPLTGFVLFMASAFVGGGTGLILSLLGLRGPPAGKARAKTALGLSLALLAVIAAALVMGGRVPAIHDITTDTEDPPAFDQAQHLPANRGRDLSYPHGNPQTPQKQRQAYPGIKTLRLEIAPEEAFQRALASAQAMGWSITWSNRDLKRFEAFDQTAFFRFADDVSVRVRAVAKGGSEIDVRSCSRVGQSDFGTNAHRIREFLNRLESPSPS
ncbi:MAG TPA: DUF1499 domain-containing protein [Acidobacteriota bacterium]|nr:DUF1499 domain-containing protein [Acidobacteriota bacterium]